MLPQAVISILPVGWLSRSLRPFGLIVFALSLASCSHRHVPVQPQPSSPPSLLSPIETTKNPVRRLELSLGMLLERELSRGEAHRYELTLDTAQFLRFLVYQDEIDVAVRVLSPAGVEVLGVDGPAGRQVAEQFSWVTQEAGDYRLEIRSVDTAQAPGSYRVEMEEMRAATPLDPSRIAAERYYVEAVHWRVLGTAKALRRALDAYKVAQPFWQAAGDVGEEGKTVNQMGMTLLRMGETREALERFQEALALRRKAGDEPGQADTVTNIGAAYQGLGQVRQALDWYQQALQMWENIGNPPATIYQRLGSAYLDTGLAREALDYFQQALWIRRQAQNLSEQASILNSMGICHRRLGDLPNAIKSYKEALRISRETQNPRVEASALSGLGQAYRLTGEIHKALTHYHEALAINRRRGNRAPIAQVAQNLGTAYVALGRMDTARRYYKEALAHFLDLENEAAETNVRRNLAWVDISLGNVDEALANLNEALAKSRALDDRHTEADTLFALGSAYLSQNQPHRAMVVLNDGLYLWRKLGQPAREAATLSNLGVAHHQLGDLEQAVEFLRQARSLSVHLNNRTIEALSLLRLAQVERDRGNIEHARSLLAPALDITDRQRSQVPTPELRATFFARVRQYYELEIDLLIRLHQDDPKGGYDIAAFEASEKARARSLLDLLHERRNDIDRGIDPELRSREKSLWARLSQIQSQLIQEYSADSPQAENVAALTLRLREVEEEQERLELEIRHKHRHYAELRYPEPLQLEEIQRLLDPQTALLEYVIGDQGTLVFAITRQDALAVPLPASTSQIHQLVQQTRGALVRPGRNRLGGYRLAAYRLYELLIAPAMEAVGDKSHLLIVADRSLHHLPFEALLTQSPRSLTSSGLGELPYLIKRWSVSYAPSASVLASLIKRRVERSGPARGKSFIAFADPAYGASASGETPRRTPSMAARPQPRAAPHYRFERLHHSEREVREIAKLYPEEASVLYLRGKATEGNVKNNDLVENARRLHFATHGLLDEGQPQYYGLVLTPDENSGQDGLLQVYEIFNLKLQAELVVLSACETGLGQEVTGEGLLGLSRAFFYAGTSRVLVSLWSVADSSTADLMVRFYQELDSPESPAAALQASKLALLKDRRFAHPYHWASFVLSGAP